MKYFYFLFLSFFFLNSFSQPGTWTWMHGSNTPNSFGNFGTQGMAAATNVPPAVYEACEWTDNQGRFWMFGGIDVHNVLTGFDCYNALWMYDPATNLWTWMKGGSTRNNPGIYGTKGLSAPANTPGARTFAAMTWVDNQNNLWMYGGMGYDVTGAIQGNLGDLWKYTIASNEWTWVSGYNIINKAPVNGTKGMPVPTNYPGSRNESAACWIENNNLWFFGGLATTGALNDMWRYNITTDEWTWMHGTTTVWGNGIYGTKGVPAANNVPSARMVYAKWKDVNGGFWMFGGSSANGYENDLWKYDVATNMWTWIRGSNAANSNGTSGTLCTQSSTFDPPAAYENRACWIDSCENFWMFGGRQFNAQNEFWSYNVPSNQWTKINNAAVASYGTINVAATANLPPDRFGALPFTDNQGNLWMFGGGQSIGGNYYNDLWKFVIDTNCVPWCTLQAPNANFTASNITGCANLTVNFTNTSSGSTSWNWNFGDGNTSTQQNPSNTYNNPGQYTVTLIASNGTQFDTTTQINYVTVYANAVANYTSSADTVCVKDSVNFTNSSSNATNYQWNFGNGNNSTVSNPSTAYNTSGTYSVTLIAQNANGCNDTINKIIYVKPVGAFNQNIFICNGNSYVLPGGNTVNTNGTYIDTIQSINGCDSIVTTVLTVNQNTSFSQAPTICAGNSYTLPDGTIVTTSGTYIDTIANSKGCDSIITTILTINPLPVATAVTANDTITQGESTALVATGGGVYSWNPTTTPNNSDSVFASPIVTTTYCVIVTDNNGCKDTACVTITVIEIPCPTENNLALPNAFSPNNDNINDEYCLQGWVPCVESFEIKIYNRWGEKIYESKDRNFGSDGKYND